MRAGCSERRASWELSHSSAGKGSGLTNKGIVLWYVNRKIGVGQGEDSDQQGTRPSLRTAGCTVGQAGIKGESLSLDTVCRHRRSRAVLT